MKHCDKCKADYDDSVRVERIRHEHGFCLTSRRRKRRTEKLDQTAGYIEAIKQQRGRR